MMLGAIDIILSGEPLGLEVALEIRSEQEYGVHHYRGYGKG
jgi:hypothetical protein